MKQIRLRKLLLEYAGTLEIEYVGKRCVRIKYLGAHKQHHLYRKLYPYIFDKKVINGPNNVISYYNCDGTWTYAELRLLPEQEPFIE